MRVWKMYDELITAIIFEILLTALLARNIFMLRKAIVLDRDVKAGRTESVRASISFMRTKRGHRGTAAWAVYDKDGRKMNSRMICACSMSVPRSEERDVIIGKSDGSVFVLNEQQAKDGVMTWWVFTVLAGLGLVFVAFIIYCAVKDTIR